MVIGVDIDGVLQDTEHYFRVYADLFDIDNKDKGILHPEELMVRARMEWDAEEFDDFVQNYMYKAMREAPLMPGTKEVLERLKKMGHKLVVITARGKYAQTEKDIGYEMIKREGLEFDGIRMDSMYKLPVCIEEKIDYMIEDNYSNVMTLCEGGIKCLYFRDIGRDEIIHDNCTEVHTWGEVLRFFHEKQKNDKN